MPNRRCWTIEPNRWHRGYVAPLSTIAPTLDWTCGTCHGREAGCSGRRGGKCECLRSRWSMRLATGEAGCSPMMALTSTKGADTWDSLNCGTR